MRWSTDWLRLPPHRRRIMSVRSGESIASVFGTPPSPICPTLPHRLNLTLSAHPDAPSTWRRTQMPENAKRPTRRLLSIDLLTTGGTIGLIGAVGLSWLGVLFADADPISLPGGAALIGTSLLGSVLGWMFFVHLPAKDKQMKEMMDSKDKLAVDTANIAAAAEKERRADFKE